MGRPKEDLPNKPCERCGSLDRNAENRCRPCLKAYNASPERRAAHEKYRHSLKGKAVRAAYLESAHGKAKRAAYLASPRGKANTAASCRRTKYGIEPDEYERMWVEQRGKCGSCGDPLKHDGYDTHVDHDHDTHAVRGLLCRFCNNAAGCLKDSPLRARKLAAYLERHQPKLKLVRKETGT